MKRNGQGQIKTCRRKQHVKTDGMKGISNLFCGIFAVGGNYNLTRDNTSLMHKNNNAYIYCMYGLKYDEKHYDAKNNKYYYVIPWKYIEPLWQGSL